MYMYRFKWWAVKQIILFKFILQNTDKFDTYENYKSFIARWQKEQRFDKDLLKQHYNLVFFTGMLNKDNAGRFLQSQYPALKPYDKSPIFRAPFSSVKITQDFWQNNSRIKHDDEFYFEMDAN